jgi:hypothetical protein
LQLQKVDEALSTKFNKKEKRWQKKVHDLSRQHADDLKHVRTGN